MHTVPSFGICQGMSWQYLNQPCGWIGSTLSRSLRTGPGGPAVTTAARARAAGARSARRRPVHAPPGAHGVDDGPVCRTPARVRRREASPADAWTGCGVLGRAVHACVDAWGVTRHP